MLTLSSVCKGFGGLQVLEGVTLTVPARGIFGLIGPNGAGKTTVFNLITGLLAPSSGTIEFMGQRLDGKAPYQVARSGVARTFQMGDHPRSSVLSVLMPGRGYREADNEEREDAYGLLTRVELIDKSDRLAGTLSYGEQRRLELARALATKPKLLLLDEPAAGMNHVEKQQLMDEIVKLEDGGLTILIIEHDMRFIMELCKEIAVLNFGRLIAQGTPAEIRASPQVIEAYLGSGQSAEASAQR